MSGSARWQNLRARLRGWSEPARVGRRSLVNRLLALLLVGVVTINLVGIAALGWTSSNLIEDGLRKQAVQWVAELEELGIPLYASRTHKDLTAVAARVKNFPEIAFVRYYDATGKRVLRDYGWQRPTGAPLTNAQRRGLAALKADEQPYLFESDGGQVRIIAPMRVRAIRQDGLFSFDPEDSKAESVKVIGYIDLGIDRSFYRAQLVRSIAIGSVIMAIVFAITLVLGRRLIRKALQPLTSLQVPLARLASGDTDVSVTTHGDREIVAIGQALNATIAALKQRDDALRRLAEHDGLTGLYNRHHFSRLLDAEIERCRTRGCASALLFIDLDRFKYVNDMLGHGAGDKLLMQIATLLTRRVRVGDTVARFGGDEFAAIVREVTPAEALEIARAINTTMRDFVFVEQEQAFSVYCSIGIAMIARDCRDAEDLLSRADAACLEAKSRGRNRCHLFEPAEDGTIATLQDMGWSQLIKQALKDGSFRLAYQPIVSVNSQCTEHYEVLLRLPDTSGKRVSPAVFLPVAERFGLLPDIDRWVVVAALQALAAHRAQGREVVFSINLSGHAVEDPEIVQLIKDTLHTYRIPPAAVVFEITEQVAVRHVDKARRLVEELSRLGCRFALDDFGVGFSSFNHLKNFPVSYIKIDGAFVENMAHASIDQAIVRSIAEIGKASGKIVVAEFVQDEATLRLLREYGVDCAQGYFIGKPRESLPPFVLPDVKGSTG